jgi:acyl carrier protein
MPLTPIQQEMAELIVESLNLEDIEASEMQAEDDSVREAFSTLASLCEFVETHKTA